MPVVALRNRNTRRNKGEPACAALLLLLLVLGAGFLIPVACAGQSPKKGDFLIAGRELRDPNFNQTVVLMIAHDEEGAMGLVINRRTPVPVREVFTESRALSGTDARIYLGGPVSPNQFFILARVQAPPSGSLHLLEDLHLIDMVFLESLLDGGGAPGFRVYAGYAGWGAGQLDGEIARGDWHVLPGDGKSVLSDEPGTLWQRLIERSTAVWAGAGGGVWRGGSVVPHRDSQQHPDVHDLAHVVGGVVGKHQDFPQQGVLGPGKQRLERVDVRVLDHPSQLLPVLFVGLDDSFPRASSRCRLFPPGPVPFRVGT
jgi:putative transcriptional regulator